MMFGSVSVHFANLQHVKYAKLVFPAWMHYFKVQKLWSIHFAPLDRKWCLSLFQSISLTSITQKDGKLVFRTWMHYFGVLKLQSIHSTPLEPSKCLIVFRSISLIFCTLKEAKLVFQGLNALFRYTKVANHPFYSIGTKMMFGSVSEHFANLLHVKRSKTCVSGPECTISGYWSCESSILLHWNQNDVWEAFGAFR
jgi:hypothetical protein